MKKLTPTQQGVVHGATKAIVVSTLFLVSSVNVIPGNIFSPSFLLHAIDKYSSSPIKFSLRVDAVFVLPLLLMSIIRLANLRFASPQDIDGSGLTVGTAKAKELQAVLQNTLEQTVLKVSTHVVYAAVMPPSCLGAIFASGILFTVGRIFFIRGYRFGAPGRALGFGLTFYPTFLMLVATVLRIIYEVLVGM